MWNTDVLERLCRTYVDINPYSFSHLSLVSNGEFLQPARNTVHSVSVPSKAFPSSGHLGRALRTFPRATKIKFIPSSDYGSDALINDLESIDEAHRSRVLGVYIIGSVNTSINITDSVLRHLARLTSMTDLHLDFTDVDDITPLSRLTNLTELNLDCTKVATVEWNVLFYHTSCNKVT